ncbi:hypothetical protein BaRGS_00027631 [Batillaria attramentaria]|uniref:Major facilitator superfamily (MFS) profile domain-containing protein n=1 Tax=Batillaria attramentaria TaxID=370345 RepID=A0ABD0K266_9CAEN
MANSDASELRRLDVDEIWRALGRCGRFQLFQTLVLVIAGIPMSFPVLSVVFQGDSGPFKCRASPEFLASGIWRNDSDTVLSKSCQISMADNTTGKVYTDTACDGYDYEKLSYTSFVSEWDLVCERAPLAQLSQTLIMAGMFAGALVLSPLADKYGRKTLHVVCHVMLFVVSIAMAFMPNYASLFVTKFFAGVFQMGYMIPWVISLLELFPTEQRALVGMGSSFMWAISIICMTPIAYVTRNYSWRTMQIVLAAFSAFSFLEIFLLDESLRWLVANRRIADIRRAICKASRLNQKDPDVVINTSLARAEARQYIELAANITNTACSETLVTIAEVAEDETETPEENPEVDQESGSSTSAAAQTALTLAGRFGITGAFNAVWIYTPELFPTNIRNVGVGIGSSCARVGGMAAPFFKLVADVSVWAPGATFSALCLVVTLLLWSLPETMHRPLPQRILDVKTWRQQDRKEKKQSQTRFHAVA